MRFVSLEMLEASFDIVQDASAVKQQILEAEALLVLCRVIKILAPPEERRIDIPPIVLRSPLWFLRLSSSRLSDAILDLLLVPNSETIRESIRGLFTTCTACPPIELNNQQRHSGKYKRKAREIKASLLDFLDRKLSFHENLPTKDSKRLPTKAAKRVRLFASHGNLPYPMQATKALDVIRDSASKIHRIDMNSGTEELKRLSENCFREIFRCINQLKQLLKALEALGIVPAIQNEKIDGNEHLSPPAYISIDLGLRQKRQHSKFFSLSFLTFLGASFLNLLNFHQCQVVFSFKPFYCKMISLRTRRKRKRLRGGMPTEEKAAESPKGGGMMTLCEFLDLLEILEVSS